MVTNRRKYEIVFKPKLHQRHALEAVRLFPAVWMCGGLGSGKSWILVWYCWFMMTEWAPGVDGLLIEPDYDTFRQVFMVLWRRLFPGEDYVWQLRSSTKHGLQLVVKTPCGKESCLYIRSGHNEQYARKIDSLTTIGWGAFDEPGRTQCGELALRLLFARTRNKEMNEFGWPHNPKLVVGVPFGLEHWLAQRWGCTEDHPAYAYKTGYVPQPTKKPGYYIRPCRTSDNADNLGVGYEQETRDLIGDVLASQWFEASLMATQGMVFPEWSRGIHVIPNDLADELWAQRAIAPMGGSDEGSTAPAAALAMSWTPDNELLVIDEWYETGSNVVHQIAEMLAMERLWTPRSAAAHRLGIEGFQWFHDPASLSIDLMRSGVIPTDKDKFSGQLISLDVRPAKYHGSSSTHTSAPSGWEARISLLRNLMVPRPHVRHPNPKVPENVGCPRFLVAERCVNLIKEIPGYRKKPQEEGRPPREGAVGHDHAIDSVCGAAITTVTTGSPRTW